MANIGGGWGGFYGGPPATIGPNTVDSALTRANPTVAIAALVAEYTGGSWADLLDRLERKHGIVLAQLTKGN